MTQPPIIIGLEKPVDDPKTGVMLGFHVVRMYQVDLTAPSTMVVLASFVSRAAFDAGKSQVTSISVSGVEGEPSGNAAQWCYARLLDSGVNHILSGAVPHYADEAQEVSE